MEKSVDTLRSSFIYIILTLETLLSKESPEL